MRWLKTKGTAWLSLASLIAYLAISVAVRNEVRLIAGTVLKMLHRR